MLHVKRTQELMHCAGNATAAAENLLPQNKLFSQKLIFWGWRGQKTGGLRIKKKGISFPLLLLSAVRFNKSSG